MKPSLDLHRLAMRVPFRKNEIAKLRRKSAGAETLGMLPNALAIELVLLQFKRLDGLDDRIGGLLVEEQAGLAVDHGFEGAAFAERQDGRAAGLRLQRRDAEIFLRRENEGLGSLEMLLQHVVRL